jgi:hypothetical protein
MVKKKAAGPGLDVRCRSIDSHPVGCRPDNCRSALRQAAKVVPAYPAAQLYSRISLLNQCFSNRFTRSCKLLTPLVFRVLVVFEGSLREIEMRLTFKFFDGRQVDWVDVIDEDTGEKVGYIHSQGVGFERYGGITVSLFGGKYSADCKRYEECKGFVTGVETVLRYLARHLTDTGVPKQPTSAASAKTEATVGPPALA